MKDITLNEAQSLALAMMILAEVEAGKSNSLDGFAHYFSIAQLNANYPTISREYGILKTMMAKKAEHVYPSFEGWFPSPLALTQTRMYYSDNLKINIGMGDGWTQEVRDNVIARLIELNIPMSDSLMAEINGAMPRLINRIEAVCSGKTVEEYMVYIRKYYGQPFLSFLGKWSRRGSNSHYFGDTMLMAVVL